MNSPNSNSLHCIVGFLVIAFAIHSGAYAQTSVESELEHVRTANDDLKTVGDAKLALEQYYLEQVRALRANGHASWVEVARQEQVINSLQAQLNSLNEFSLFVARVEKLTKQNANKVSLVSDRQRNPIKIYLPGSQRMLGWIETTLQNRNQESKKTGNEDVIAAQQRLQRAQKQYSKLNALKSSPKHWVHQAKLKLNLAQAELDSITRRYDLADIKSADSSSLVRIVELKLHLEDDDFISVDAGDELKLANYQVAWAEANANGKVELFDADFQHQKERVELIERLNKNGFASNRELEMARENLVKAESKLKAEKARIQNLIEICNRLERSEKLASKLPVAKGELTSRLDSNCQWPLHILSDTTWIRHLIDLRREYFHLLAQRDSLKSKLRMKQECLNKLQRAFASNQTRNSDHQSTTALRATLKAGEQTQIDSLKRELTSISTQITHINQQQAILALEENRFIAQTKYQWQVGNASFAAAGNPQLYRISNYLESSDLQDLIDLNVSAWSPGYYRFSFEERDRLPLITSSYSRTVQSNISSNTNLDHQKYRAGLSCISVSRSPVPLRNSDFRERYRFGPSSTYDLYPNGILRADLRRHLPAGYVPWYLPGSPTNIQHRSLLTK